MKHINVLSFAASLVAVLAIAGCGSNSSDSGSSSVATGTSVPASAGESVNAFINYLASLNPNDETSEPATLSDSFAVPEDETNDARVLS